MRTFLYVLGIVLVLSGIASIVRATMTVPPNAPQPEDADHEPEDVDHEDDLPSPSYALRRIQPIREGRLVPHRLRPTIFRSSSATLGPWAPDN